jgi:hypothetical protein
LLSFTCCSSGFPNSWANWRHIVRDRRIEAIVHATAAASRAYQLQSDMPGLLSTGNTTFSGPGNGRYAEAYLQGVNGGDLIAMELFNNTHNTQFWAFAQANEQVNGQGVGHLWNYASNVWGWEDTLGGGDRDYNDLVVGYDFTSAAGHGILK